MSGLFAKRGFVGIVEVVYLLGLFAIAFFYIAKPESWLHTILPSTPGSLPAGVLWFGALGAVIISLSGTFDHRTDWDPSWALWHFTRPLIGMSLAIIAWLTFQAGILAVGSTPAAGNAQGVGAPTNYLFYLIAFVVGYREQVFREMIKRVADVIIMPSANGSASTGAPANGGDNASGTLTTVQGTSTTVHVTSSET